MAPSFSSALYFSASLSQVGASLLQCPHLTKKTNSTWVRHQLLLKFKLNKVYKLVNPKINGKNTYETQLVEKNQSAYKRMLILHILINSMDVINLTWTLPNLVRNLQVQTDHAYLLFRINACYLNVCWFAGQSVVYVYKSVFIADWLHCWSRFSANL